MPLPLVAIVGAPNVGKSTLFNRLAGGRRAIVTDEPGVTRDRLYGEVNAGARRVRIVDTGGMTPGVEAPFAREIEQQASAALDEAAVVLFVVDARAGVTALDLELATMLRRRCGEQLLLVANKVDTPRVDDLVLELHRLGLGEPIGVSAEHGYGIGELWERIETMLESHDPSTETDASSAELRVAIVGRPNVGKSSILNRLAGEERAVVSEIAGTTRDAIDTRIEIDGARYRIVDTAGIRRRGKVTGTVERVSVDRARQNIDGADVVVLVLDGTEELSAQDAHVAGYVMEAHKPMVVAVNKWDIVEEREQAAKDWAERVRYRLKFARQVPIVLVSARTGQRVASLLQRAAELYELSGRRVPTAELNRWIERIAGRGEGTPSTARGVKVFYVTQTGVHPPTFVVFCNDPKKLHFSQQRHIENSLREHFAYGPVPLRMQFRARPRRDRG